jgi:predicted acetyltransferase
MVLQLRELIQTDEQAFFEGQEEWRGESPHWHSFAWKEGMTFPEMLEILRRESAGIDLAPGRVQHTMLYGFLDGKIIGRVSVRHTLNDRLRQRGGHIGYAIAPKHRRNGYAKEMVRQGLEFCRKIGLDSIMVTCGDDNVPSWKIIEHFGGTLQDRVWDEEDGEMMRRYWIGAPA